MIRNCVHPYLEFCLRLDAASRKDLVVEEFGYISNPHPASDAVRGRSPHGHGLQIVVLLQSPGYALHPSNQRRTPR